LNNFSNWTDLLFQKQAIIPEDCLPSVIVPDEDHQNETIQVNDQVEQICRDSKLEFGGLDGIGEFHEDETFSWMKIDFEHSNPFSAAIEFATQSKSSREMDRAETRKFAKLFVEAIVPKNLI
jgi:hypothetical protein